MINFLQSNVPHRYKESKELVSHDVHTSVYNYKYTYMLEMPRICKDDLIIMPKALCKELGGVNALGVCTKVTNNIHLYDPVTLRTYQMNADQYFKYENDCELIQFRGQEAEFMVVGVEADRDMASKMHTTFNNFEFKFAHVDLQVPSTHELKFTDCYFGNILKHGDMVLGYDIKKMNFYEELEMMSHQRSIPDVILIRKHYPDKKRRKLWKLQRMDIEKNELAPKKPKKGKDEDEIDMEEFMEQLEQDKGMRSKINLIRDEAAIKEYEQAKKQKKAKTTGMTTEGGKTQEGQDNAMIEEGYQADFDDEEDPEMIKLGELLKDMNIDEQEDAYGDEDRDINSIVRELGAMNVDKKK